MNSHYYSVLPKFTDLMASKMFCKDFENPEYITHDSCDEFDENLYNLNELEEVFSDHILMGKRLQRTLYGGQFEDQDDDTDHPPMALTDLALKLFSKAVPNYGLDQLDMDYVSSVSECTRVSPCAMILAMIYLERLHLKNSDYLESVSPSGLFVVTMLVASKFLFESEDDIVTNQIWSEALNMDVREINQLEQKFLAAIDWRLYVDDSEFFHFLSEVEKVIALKQSCSRGWLSYSDICSIIQDSVIRKAIINSIERIIQVSAVSAFSYAVTVLSIYAAGCVVHCGQENQPSLKKDVQIKNIQQRSYADFTKTVGLEHNADPFIGDVSDSESVFSSLSESFRERSMENSDFSHGMENENPKNLSYPDGKYSFIIHSIYSLLSRTINSEYTLFSGSFQNSLVNHSLWWTKTFSNTCIPISVQ